jgi:hypothetical protein
MKIKLLEVILFTCLISASAKAQDPLSFFPHGVGDRWEYVDNWGNLTIQTITRDSIGPDGSHNLFYYYSYPNFRIDTALNVFEAPTYPSWNYLLYKLDADTGDIWAGINDGINWAWCVSIDSAYVFSILTTIKIFRYGPGRPDSTNTPGFLENWLASGFGLIYSESEVGFHI